MWMLIFTLVAIAALIVLRCLTHNRRVKQWAQATIDRLESRIDAISTQIGAYPGSLGQDARALLAQARGNLERAKQILADKPGEPNDYFQAINLAAEGLVLIKHARKLIESVA